LLIDHIDLLRDAVCITRRNYPFAIDAMVVLPDHIHAVWTLPEGDANFPTRWRSGVRSRSGFLRQFREIHVEMWLVNRPDNCPVAAQGARGLLRPTGSGARHFALGYTIFRIIAWLGSEGQN
jgi:hypothetical protein